jgi:hypothetical protein
MSPRHAHTTSPPAWAAGARGGRRDAIVPRAALLNIVHAAPRGTIVRWYDAPHALDRAALP